MILSSMILQTKDIFDISTPPPHHFDMALLHFLIL